MDEQTVEIYNQNFEKYVDKWEQTSAVVSSLLPHIFVSETTILEIGFGSGRDLSFLKNKRPVGNIRPYRTFRHTER